MDPRLVVALSPATGTFASPSTSTETDPRVPTAPCIEAMACAFTPATGAPVVPTKEVGITFAFATIETVPTALVATIDFGGDKTSTAGDFTVVFPAAAASTAIIRIA